MRLHALRLRSGLVRVAVVLAAMTPLLLPDPWDIVYAVTVAILGTAYLIGRGGVHG